MAKMSLGTHIDMPTRQKTVKKLSNSETSNTTPSAIAILEWAESHTHAAHHLPVDLIIPRVECNRAYWRAIAARAAGERDNEAESELERASHARGERTRLLSVLEAAHARATLEGEDAISGSSDFQGYRNATRARDTYWTRRITFLPVKVPQHPM